MAKFHESFCWSVWTDILHILRMLAWGRGYRGQIHHNMSCTVHNSHCAKDVGLFLCYSFSHAILPAVLLFLVGSCPCHALYVSLHSHTHESTSGTTFSSTIFFSTFYGQPLLAKELLSFQQSSFQHFMVDHFLPRASSSCWLSPTTCQFELSFSSLFSEDILEENCVDVLLAKWVLL